MIAVTGCADPSVLAEDTVVKGMAKEDFLIILGNCPVAMPRTDREDLIRMFRALPCSVLFIDGEAEDHDYLGMHPQFPWNGGMVQNISRGITRLMRGQVFSVGGMTFLTMGGGTTSGRSDIGKYWDWWPEQDISATDIAEAEKNLGRCGGHVDFVVSYECASSWKCGDVSVSSDRLEKLAGKVSCGAWYFGRCSEDADLPEHGAYAVRRRVIPVVRNM